MDALTDDDDAEAKLLEEYCFDLQVCLQCMLGCLLVSVMHRLVVAPWSSCWLRTKKAKKRYCVQLVWLCGVCGVTSGCVCVRAVCGYVWLCVAMWITLWT